MGKSLLEVNSAQTHMAAVTNFLSPNSCPARRSRMVSLLSKALPPICDEQAEAVSSATITLKLAGTEQMIEHAALSPTILGCRG